MRNLEDSWRQNNNVFYLEEQRQRGKLQNIIEE